MRAAIAFNPDLIHFVLTFAGWGGAYVVLLVVSRFVIVKKNALERASATLGRVRAILAAVSAKCSEESMIDPQEAIRRLATAKRLLLRADKMVSVYQYDHSDLMDLGGIRSSISSLVSSSEALAVAIQKNDGPEAMGLLEKLQKTTSGTIASINSIEESQSKVTLI